MRRIRFMRHVRLGIKNLMLHKLRSLLTMLGVVFGVGSVVAMLAVGEGASKEALQKIHMLGSKNIIVSSVKPVEEVVSGSVRRRMSVYGLLYEDEVRIRESFDPVERTVSVKLMREEGRLGSRVLELRVVGTIPAWFELVDRPVIAGRVLIPRDVQDHAAVVVLTEYGARRLLAVESTVGQSIKIGSDYFEVVGIVKSEDAQAGSIQMPDQEVDAYIPLNVARQYFGDITIRRSAGSRERERVELHQLIVQARSTEDVESIAAGIETMLKRFHKNDDYRISVPLALLREAQATKRRFNIVLGSIAGISLLVGGIGIMNIMLASVTERTREIGVRRAIGAKRRQIIVQFLIETIVLSTIGGIIGVGVGLSIPRLITHFAGMPTVVTALSIAVPLFISSLIGVIFGLYPAIRAANLDPIVALRHE